MDPRILSKKYTGNIASTYERSRNRSEKWATEQAAVEELLDELPMDATILDIPVGTGRFLELYQERRFRIIGMDISSDMLRHACSRDKSIGNNVEFVVGDIFNIAAADNSCDAVVCMRFLNWLDTHYLKKSLEEIVRVAGKTAIIGIRHKIPFVKTWFWREWWERFVPVARGRVGRVKRRKGLVIHKYDEVQAIFKEVGILVEKSICIETERWGAGYYVYRLSFK